ncbi:hypothetical protein M2451_000871 [Dysgonomonas sp. PFB1-18]|uniref:hypothetical protein n=1 Tax=unclassified Dysgonomonas TaxID=2630389 RepID=UPI0024732FF9|nr:MULTISPECIES: hypothetical protein [unclassified Dysgonomonas]MDH6308560.1 hypothetical protein [Dysgonomonas sp. PF1-14]MDH6338061.1 hypothetical protein [Dysgonomonas sp. PF1-16]MDH6379558.1 hypothetical protein [Dysgonomonas sp. PFB1-18]MDH6396888.1 hypothetical protein [Dysgonomonas sp. PF1-23]
MNSDIRTRIINTITQLIPSNIKPVDYLSEVLDIGKESAYRRLRGKMSFSFEELFILSQKLDFSLDKLRKDNEKGIYPNVYYDPEGAFIERLKRYKDRLDMDSQENTDTMMIAINYLPVEFTARYSSLFKFFYYTWLHRRHTDLSKLYYADVYISSELETLRTAIGSETSVSKDIVFILDPNVFLSPLREVHYFHGLNLISDAEASLIKIDFNHMIDYIEKIARTGQSDSGIKYNFYISSFNIDVNSSYNILNGRVISFFDFQFFSQITLTTPRMCGAHKEWLESLKRYSTLITESNEAAQAEYFERQRKYIDRI